MTAAVEALTPVAAGTARILAQPSRSIERHRAIRWRHACDHCKTETLCLGHVVTDTNAAGLVTWQRITAICGKCLANLEPWIPNAVGICRHCRCYGLLTDPIIGDLTCRECAAAMWDRRGLLD